MNYAQKNLLQALKELKKISKQRKAADVVLRDNAVLITLATASGKTVTMTLPREDNDCHALAVSAADTVASETYHRETQADEEVTRWAREVVLLADKAAQKLAEFCEPITPEAAVPPPAPEAWPSVFLAALRSGQGVGAAARAAGIPYEVAHRHKAENPAFRAEFDAALLGQFQQGQ